MTDPALRGRVYRTFGPAWRAVISRDGGEEVGRGGSKTTPAAAWEDLRVLAQIHGCEDIKKWSGTWPPPGMESES